MKKILTIILSLSLLVIGCSACADKSKKSAPSASPKQSAPAATETSKGSDKDVYANKIFFTIEMENGGVMKGELYPDLAPITVANFVKLADAKFYDGDDTVGPKKAKGFLESLKIDQQIVDHVEKIVKNISFKGGNHQQEFRSGELDVVQDADRLDAL